MILKSITPINWGPFTSEQTLEVSDRVTVLTGANDVGKSSLLGLIQKLYDPSENGKASEFDRNFDRAHLMQGDWRNDDSLGGIATFVANQYTAKYFTAGVAVDDEIIVRFNAAPGKYQRKVEQWKHKGGWRRVDHSFGKMPHIVVLSELEGVHDVILLNKPNSTERQLLRVAFGPNFSYENLHNLQPVLYTRELSRARQRLNEQVSRHLPQSLGLSFQIEQVGGSRDQLAIFLIDRHTGHTPLGSRGSGIRKLVTLLVHLLTTVHLDKEQVMICIDEPENSLHADAQHLLRTVLETLAVAPNVQVVYSTHSPSMINIMNPNSLRVLERLEQESRASTRIENKPYRDNYGLIRTSLGLTPADSLLFARVTLIVEGDSEIVGLPIALRKMAEAKVHLSDAIQTVFREIHILGGMGDSFEYLCRLAKSQGAKPAICVDGDKIRRVRQQDVSGRHSDVPIIHLPEGMEFEQVIPMSIYMEALAEVIGTESESLGLSQFQEWLSQQADPVKRRMFSKQVEAWLESVNPQLPFVKPAVMRAALEKCPADLIRYDELEALVGKILTLLE